MAFTGWGRYPQVAADIYEPVDATAISKFVTTKKNAPLITRGAGRSYGDSSLCERLLSSRFLDSFISVDEAKANLRCGAGITLEEVLRLAIPKGWFLPVLPGTRYVTVGGAIAADIHGKNHHIDGAFSAHVKQISLLLASGEVVICSEQDNSDLFRATCGGMGLTGVIIDATLSFKRVSSVFINRQSLIADDLESCFSSLEEHEDSKYSVAWLDCLAKGNALGRSVIYLAEHIEDESKGERKELKFKSRGGLSVPFNTPSFLLNKYSMGAFNKTFFSLKSRASKSAKVHYDSYFFPLDNIGHWNRLYGSKGFLQYQFVVPTKTAFDGITEVLNKVSASGKGSFLSVLKKFGAANKNYLSFPMEGFTLTLDFKYEEKLFALLDELDAIVIKHGGRIYLAKDARMSQDVFRAGYPQLDKFLQVKQQFDPDCVFASKQSERLGLT